MLGNAYKTNNDFNTALTHFNSFYEISKKIKDVEAFGKASEALADCYKK